MANVKLEEGLLQGDIVVGILHSAMDAGEALLWRSIVADANLLQAGGYLKKTNVKRTLFCFSMTK
jgi:hypothetical protein